MGDYDLKLINRVDTVKEVYNFHIVSTHNDKGCMGVGTAEISFRNGAIQNTLVQLPEGMTIELSELKGAIAAIEDKILTSSRAFRGDTNVVPPPVPPMASKTMPCAPVPPAMPADPELGDSQSLPPAPSIPRVIPKAAPRANYLPRKDFPGL